MTVHHIFFIHGIGTHSSNWVVDEGIHTLMQKTWIKYPSLTTKGSFDNLIKCHSIQYNDVFQQYINRWGEMAGRLKGELNGHPDLKPADFDYLIDLSGKPQAGEDEQDFFFTHILDVVLYRFFDLIQEDIIAQCADQIFSLIEQYYMESDVRFSLVGHSMGTAVAHATLQKLFTHPAYLPSLRQALKFELFAQISNTSFVLSRDRNQHYKTIVYPSKFPNRGVCRKMLCMSHKLDLICELIPFEPEEDWPNSRDCKYLEKILISKIKQKDIHCINHYFENPKVHVPFFNALFSNAKIPAEEAEKTWNQYLTETPDSDFKNLRTKLEALQSSTRQSWSETLQAFRQFLDSTRNL